MGFLIYDAPAPRELPRTNIVRCTVNQIIRFGDAVGLKGRVKELRPGDNPNAPYWDLVFETLDAKFSDGNPLLIVDSTKLTDKNGEWLGNDQRPYRIGQAFAGLGIRSFPATPEAAAAFPDFDLGIDESYDPSLIVGRAFKVESLTLKDRKGERMGRDLYLPTEAYPADYVYPDQPRVITAKTDQGVSTNGAGVPVAAAVIDIRSDETARNSVVNALAGTPADDDAVMTVLRANGLGNLAIGNERFLDLLSDDRLVTALVEAGFVTVSDGQLVTA